MTRRKVSSTSLRVFDGVGIRFSVNAVIEPGWGGTGKVRRLSLRFSFAPNTPGKSRKPDAPAHNRTSGRLRRPGTFLPIEASLRTAVACGCCVRHTWGSWLEDSVAILGDSGLYSRN